MPPEPARVLLDYEPPGTRRRDRLWQLALTVARVHLALLTLALVLNAFGIPKAIREVQWHNLTGRERFVIWMGYVGLLHALATLSSLLAVIALHRIANRRSAWPLLLLYVLPHLALLATYETAVLLVGRPTITLSQSPGSASLFIVNNPYLRLAYYALLSVPLLMIAYNLIDHFASRAPATRQRDAGSST